MIQTVNTGMLKVSHGPLPLLKLCSCSQPCSVSLTQEVSEDRDDLIHLLEYNSAAVYDSISFYLIINIIVQCIKGTSMKRISAGSMRLSELQLYMVAIRC